MSRLFSSFSLRTVTFKNRIFLSPMCQYSSSGGLANGWHLVHLGSRAVGGASLVLTEATAVSPEGRISPWDLGIWSAEHARALKPVAAFIQDQGAVPGIQLAHAGRKASVDVPWRGGSPLPAEAGGWQPLAPSAIAFDNLCPEPRALTTADLDEILSRFAAAAVFSVEAGFKVLEIHMAHGYLLHEFLSPLANQRTDSYGGSFENRTRFPLAVARAVRDKWPADLPLFIRISCTDWVVGGWDLAQSIDFTRQLKAAGIDLIDCSSGGLVPQARIPAGPGYQTPFAAGIRTEAGLPTGTVGLITSPVQAEQIVATGQADVVFLGRELLRNPYWPLQAAKTLRADIDWPPQYVRAKTP